MVVFVQSEFGLAPVTGGNSIVAGYGPVEGKWKAYVMSGGLYLHEKTGYSTEDDAKQAARNAINNIAAKIEAGGGIIIILTDEDF